MVVVNKWGKGFWQDCLERTAATFVTVLLSMLTLVGVTPLDWTFNSVWAGILLPTLITFFKSISANLINPESGASLLDSPPGPVISNREDGVINWVAVAAIAIAVFVVVWLIFNLDVNEKGDIIFLFS